jgi:UDP-GlcNAc:undecaprenyl-phosphate/decaprenyl-phosphate GlcNAc-1-phosphate transferase
VNIIVVYPAAFVGAALASAGSLPFWRRWCRRSGAMDEPGRRKIHTDPVPLAGGLAVMTGLLTPVLAGAALAFSHSRSSVAGLFEYGLSARATELLGIMAGALGMLLIGLRDDQVELRPATKFGSQLLIALIVAAAGVRITLFVPSLLFHYAITVLWILTVVNAFNFMDNMNGLCAGLGVIGAGWFGMMAARQGQYLVGAISFLTAGALAGFLPRNFPRASVFLGDAGSHLTGFLMAVLAILPHFYTAHHRKPLAVLTPLLVLAVPLGDMVWVVILRWRMGRPVYIGDTNHLSHRLVRRQLSPAQAVMIIWGLACLAGGLAFLWQ